MLRAPALAACRAGALRNVAASLVWHDTADAALAESGLAVCQTGVPGSRAARWRLERLHPGDTRDWAPATPPPLLAEEPDPDRLAHALPGALTPAMLAPAAAFQGRLRTLPLQLAHGPAQMFILAGTLRGVARDQPACRVLLAGAAADVGGLAQRLAETINLLAPCASLAADAMALARGCPPKPRHAGAPALPSGLAVGEGLACITAHLVDVILHWARLVPGAADPEPVHQMRVGVRRLRSAFSVFRRAVADEAGACPWLDGVQADLRTLATRLGAARDWDVFLTQTGADVHAAFPQDRRLDQLLAAAGRRRAAAYAEAATFLGSRQWTAMAMTLTLLPTMRPWMTAGGEAVSAPVKDYAAHALDRRLKHLLSAGPDLAGLAPPQLHDIRKQAKRLRYGTEFFAPLFAGKAVRKYLPRLQQLQEVLGAVNDMEVAAGLMAELPGGADRAFAAGLVQGFGAARAARAAAKVQRSWSRLYRADPFWD